MAAAVLTIDINARLTSLEKGLTDATKKFDAFGRGINASAKSMSASMSFLSGAIKGALGAVTVGAFTALIKGSIDSADKLNDLSKSTGVAATTLGGLGFAAEQAGGNLESVGRSLGKMNLQVASALGGNKEATQVFKNLGVSIADLQKLSPEEVFAKLADGFSQVEDGATKAQHGNAIFGKSYQEILPLLDEGGQKLLRNVEYYKRYSGVTEDVIAASDQFNDTMTKLKLLTGAFGQNLAAALLPKLQVLADTWLENKEKGDQFRGSAERMTEVMTNLAAGTGFVVNKFVNFGTLLGARAAQIEQFVTGNFKGASFISDAVQADITKADKDLSDFIARLRSSSTAVATTASFGATTATRRRQLPALDKSGGGAADDPSKKILEGRLRELEAILSRETALLRAHNEIREAYFHAGLISLSDFFERSNVARLREVELQRATFTEEKRLLEQRINQPGLKKTEQEDARNKLIELNKKLQLSEIEAGKQGELAALKQKLAFEDYGRVLDEINAKLLEQQGRIVEAAAIRIRNANAQERRALESQAGSGDDNARAALARLDTSEKLTLSQAKLNDLNAGYSLVLEQVSNRIERINIARDSGAITELQALSQIANANKQRLADLQRQLDAMTKLAETFKGQPIQAGILANIDALLLRMEQLSAQTDLVADKFRKIFADSFTDAFADVIDGTKSLSDAFKSMERSILSTINRIAAQNIAESLFGKGGSFGSGGGFDIGGLIAKFFSSGYADGTNYASPGWHVVGERGAELAKFQAGGQVIPNEVFQAMRSAKSRNIVNNVNINVMGPISRHTSSQLRRETARGLQEAMRDA